MNHVIDPVLYIVVTSANILQQSMSTPAGTGPPFSNYVKMP